MHFEPLDEYDTFYQNPVVPYNIYKYLRPEAAGPLQPNPTMPYRRTTPSATSRVLTVYRPARKGGRARAQYRSGGSVPRVRGPIAAMGDTKWFDTEYALTAISNSSSSWATSEANVVTNLCLFSPVQGNGVSNRMGNKAYVKKIFLRMGIRTDPDINETVVEAAYHVRVLLVQDTQCNGTEFQGEQVLENPDSTTALNVALAPQNIENFGRFKVLKDKTFYMPATRSTWDGTNLETDGGERLWKWTHKFKRPVMVKFNNTNGGTVADIIDNSWGIIALCTRATQDPRLTYYSRVTFTG